MQYLKIDELFTLSDLGEIVGYGNVEYILSANNLTRTPKIGKQFFARNEAIIENSHNSGSPVDWATKIKLLNNVVANSEIFETLACAGEDEWAVYSQTGTLSNMLLIPDTVVLKDAVDVFSDDDGVPTKIYNKVVESLETDGHTVDPDIFLTYSSTKASKLTNNYTSGTSTGTVLQQFAIPWGDVSLYSTLADEKLDIPVYPEEVSDSVKANYTQMQDIIYQYEPWQVYESSGPRSNTYTFEFHRDMWSGDHRDGKANELVRFCQANCYPEYSGSAVNSATVKLYVKGKCLISGVLTEVNTEWSGPIGLDGWYLVCKMTLSITEVSEGELSFSAMRQKPIIG